MSLTDSQIRQAPLKDKAYRMSNAKGLYLEETSAGSKCRRLKYQFAHKEKRLALGIYPKVTLKDSRKAADLAKGQLEQVIKHENG